MKTVSLPCGESVPALGIGTWNMAEDRARRAEEIATLQLALDLGVTLIDTAEMYGEGRSEELIGHAIEGRRQEAFLVSKAYPHNGTRQGVIAACERSLKRLRTDHLDLYLLHWRGNVPFSDTLEGFARLKQQGKIRHYGVSNLDTSDMEEFWDEPGGDQVASDQVLYSLTQRGIEFDLLPWLRKRRIPLMAYSPLDQGRLLRNPKLVQFAKAHGMTPAQAALKWLLTKDDIIAIPKTSNGDRLRENIGALSGSLTGDQLAELDRLFPAPRSAQPLAML
jgi:diketogulonate reductase-like aldo/keto reductase